MIEKTTPHRNMDVMNHVEMKLAARMVRDNVPYMTVVINRPVCTGIFSCDRLLPRVLPEGYKLRVYDSETGPGKLYEGQRKVSDEDRD